MAARMLLIGLWTEADDRGVFEWKPLALKIKLFPVDSVDVEALLAELIAAERVKKVEHQGKAYGICRKFCKYQRPKNPSEGHAFIREWASFVHLLPQDPRYKALGFPQDGGSPPPALPQEGVKPSADGEERREEKKKEDAAAPPSAKDRLWADGPAAIAALSQSKKPADFRSVIGGWLKAGNTPEQILAAIAKAQGEKAIDPVPYIVACLRQNQPGPRKGELRVVPRHEARRVLDAADLGHAPDPRTPEYAAWKQKRESHLRLQGIDPKSLMQ